MRAACASARLIHCPVKYPILPTVDHPDDGDEVVVAFATEAVGAATDFAARTLAIVGGAIVAIER